MSNNYWVLVSPVGNEWVCIECNNVIFRTNTGRVNEKTKKIINENKDLLALIANTLLEEETITKEEIDYLVEHGHLPEEKSTEESKEDNTKETNKKNKKEVKKEDTKSK